MKRRVQICLIFLLALAVFSPVFAFADDGGYYIKNYDIKMQVNENNSIDITENITVFFTQKRHGIYRSIPVENSVRRADGSSGVVSAKIDNVDVSEEYESYYDEDNNYTLKIGSAYEKLKGEHSYTISYTYNMGKDIGDGFDELYYNIVGDSWNTNIENVSFTIEMPKEFDASKLGFSTGKYSSVGTQKVKYNADSRVITGEVIGGLSPNEALTVRLELEEGYFKFNAFLYYFRCILMIAIPLLAFIIAFIVWLKYGKDKKIVDVVEFYPPENLNCTEVAFWYKGCVSNEDTVPLLIELANEGYLRIAEDKSGGVFKRNSFYIEKIKDHYSGKDESKRIFFNGLFKRRDRVCESDLKEKFYVHANKIVAKINSDYNIKKMFDSKSLNARFIGWIASIVSAVIIFFVYMGSYDTTVETCCLVIGFVICIITFFYSFLIRRRTDKGHEMKQKINGFKIYLETAQKEQLEAMVNDNPSYYYDILPYAYVLGVSDKWTKNFEGIVIPAPDWYYHYGPFDQYVFWRTFNHTMSSAKNSMTSVPNQGSGVSGGGFSSGGGGFSGGGSGGGGGGSW